MTARREVPMSPSEEPVPHDLRAPVLAAVAWLTALLTLAAPEGALVVALVMLLLLVARRARRGRDVRSFLGWLMVATGVAACVLLRVHAVDHNPLADLAARHATASGQLVVRSDPRIHAGRFGEVVIFRARTSEVTGRGQRHRVRAPVLVIGPGGWRDLRVGTRVTFSGRLEPASERDLSAVVVTRGTPRLLPSTGVATTAYAASDRLRASIRDVVATQPPGPRALVPGLVDGDDGGMATDLVEDFRTSGLTHLTAVSGTNLTLVVGCLLVLARWIGVRARGLVLVGALGVAAFVLLARAEPSVVRAAAMGSVALIGMGSNGRERGMRAFGVAVLVLILFDPWLAVSVGFALSAIATVSILVLAPGWRDALRRWLPRVLAEAISVPLAAQLGCTPIIAAISGKVSLVAVLANMLAEPVVGPATVLGLAGGLVGLVHEGAGRLVATPAAWCTTWLIWVARRTSALPVAALDWPARPLALVLLTLLCLVLVVALGGLLARRGVTLSVSALLVVLVLVPLPTPGWPPREWLLVACDVGQGDGLVLNAGEAGAVVVDAGPDPRAIDRCLRRLHVTRVPLVVLTHFHADHVDGIAGVLHGRQVGAIEVTTLDEPNPGVREVTDAARAAGVPLVRARSGETRTLGPLKWQVLAPEGPVPPSSESPPNDSSVVLLVQARGTRILMMGDEETPSQERLARTFGDLHVDVLKVAHHGSARQDPDLLASLGARLALISVGAGNDYGHPAPSTMHLLRQEGLSVARTDQQGDIAVVPGRVLEVVSRGH